MKVYAAQNVIQILISNPLALYFLKISMVDMSDVKYLPHFVANLLSVRKLRSNGCNVEFGNEVVI